MSKLLYILAATLLAGAVLYPQAEVQPSIVPASSLEAEIPAWVGENFKQWQMRHNRVYESFEVELYRMAVYYSNYIYIQMENARQQDFELGENEFMDMTQDEWAAKYLSKFPENFERPQSNGDEEYTVNGEKNWLTPTNVVGNVLNQGSCGSCWAFSATETIQSFLAIKTGTVPYLSEQQMVDCTTGYGNEGCNGGWPSYGMEYVKDHGQATTAQYPYTGRDGTCKQQGGSAKITTVKTSSGCSTLTQNIDTQPTSVCVDASNWSFYKSGTFSNCATNINHAVLAYGYDTNGNWLIRNSWGASWGQGGNMILKKGNTCAVCDVLANAY